MTEAYRPEANPNVALSQAIVLSGEVLAIGVTRHPSLNHTLARNRRGVDGWRGTLVKGLAVVTGTVGVGGLGIRAVLAQEPSPGASPTDRLTALNCPSPTPEPTPTPSQTPAIGVRPAGELFAFVNSKGQTVSAGLNQEAPSPVSSSEPLPSPTEPETALACPTPSASPYPSGSNFPIPSASPEASKSPDPNEVSPYSAEALLSEGLGKIDQTEIDKIIKKDSVVLARYYKETGRIPGLTTQEEVKYFQDDFNKWLKNPSVDVEGREFATQVVLDLVNTRVIEAKGGKKVANARMGITEAFYRAGLSYLREKNGDLISREKFDGWIEEISKEDWVKATEDELMHMK